MKQTGILLLTLILSGAVYGQKNTPANAAPKAAQAVVNPYDTIDKVALAIPEDQTRTTKDIAAYINGHFASDSDKARAAFIWVASNMEYDVANMYALNFYEKKEEKIDKALKTHRGICENYAYLFNDICNQCGIKSYVVTGYTKQDGMASYIPHGWCAAQLGGSWYLFDPTWGSGYLSGEQFVRHINNGYYKVAPTKLVQSHMPFDPMWECLTYPVTNQEFYEGKTTENVTKTAFYYADSISAYEQLSERDQMIAASRRIEANGVKNALVYDRLAHLRQTLEINKQNEQVHTYNSAVAEFNEGTNNFNEFINYRNKQFRPMRPDAAIQKMFDSGYYKMKDARARAGSIKDAGSNAQLIASFIKSADDAMKQADEQKEWLAKYFSKGKLARLGMFTKFTWMGAKPN